MTHDLIETTCRRSGVRATIAGKRVTLRGRGREVVWHPWSPRATAFLVGTCHTAWCQTVEAAIALVKDGPAPVRRVR